MYTINDFFNRPICIIRKWTERTNRLNVLREIARRNGWKCRNDYYKLTREMIEDFIGKGFLDCYNGSMIRMLEDLLPSSNENEKWILWKICNGKGTPKGTWDTKQMRREAVEWLCKIINFSIPDDLHKLTQNEFTNNYLRGMLVKCYETSVYNCLTDLFPEYVDSYLQWYQMVEKPKYSFDSLEKRQQAMKYVRTKLGLVCPEDFYDLSINDFNELNLGQLIYYSSKKPSFADAIIELNTDLEFDKTKFNNHKTEALVEKFLKKLGYNVTLHHVIYTTKTSNKYRVDIIIPSLNLIIEIDGDQHFEGRYVFVQQHLGFQRSLQRDVFKMQEALCKGFSIIRLVQMECWNGREEWLQENLAPLLKKYSTPTIHYIETTPKYANIYKHHKLLMCEQLSEKHLYEAIM